MPHKLNQLSPARLIALVAVLVYPLCPSHAAENAIETAASDEDWAAIENCLGIIRGCQMDSGMIRMKGHGDPVWAVPYFGNLAATALLAANDVRQNRPDVARVERWLLWYAAHREPDGTICDREGTVFAYKSNGKQDAADSCAATFLMATWRYKKAIGGRPAAEIIGAAQKAFAAIEALAQDDGLAIAKSGHAIKYLMDNIEVYQGLVEGALLFDSVGLKEEATKARRMAARIAESLPKYWSERDGHFAYALDMRGRFSSGLSKPYPDGLAQLFALSYIWPARPKLWAKVNRTFAPSDRGIPVERWLIAARRHAKPEKTKNLRAAVRNAALRFSSKNVYIERPAMAVIALLDGEARFADVPIPKTQ